MNKLIISYHLLLRITFHLLQVMVGSTDLKKRHSLHNLKLKGEQASADSVASQQYPQKFAEIIAEKCYTPDEIFNADESGLFWKKMPERTFLAKHNKSASGHKVAIKDRITILFCSNASGDYIIKPLVMKQSNHDRLKE